MIMATKQKPFYFGTKITWSILSVNKTLIMHTSNRIPIYGVVSRDFISDTTLNHCQSCCLFEVTQAREEELGRAH